MAHRRNFIDATLLGALLACALGTMIASADDTQVTVSNKQFSKTSSSLAATMSSDLAKLNTTAIASLDTQSRSLVRLDSLWTQQFEDTTQSVRVGDTISDPGTWGNAVRYAGLQLSSSQTQRADLISGNSLALSGLAILPTTADALLAMDPASQSRLAQRGLSLAKAPTVVASGVSLAAHDAAGRTTAITQALLPKQSSAQVGCKSYSVGVGRARRDYALASNNYGPLFANTNVLCGTDSGLAVEVHGEFLQGEAGIAGLNVSQKIGSGSAASVGFATSDNETGNGWALRMGLQHSDDRFDMSLRGRVQSIDYRELGMLSSDEPIAQRWLASVGAKLTDKSRLALAFTNQTTYSLHRTDILAMTQTFELGRRGTFSIAANRVFNDEDIGSINFSYVRPLRAN